MGMMWMAETFSRFDTADYLRTEEDMAAYLEAASEDGEPDMMVAALATIARARNMTQLAKDAGVTREGLYKALAPAGNPGFGTVAKVARALGYGISFKTLDIDVRRVTGSSMSGPAVSVQPAKGLVAAGGAHRGLTTRHGAAGVYSMATGKKAASDASKILGSKTSTKKEKEVAASDLSQAHKGKSGKKK